MHLILTSKEDEASMNILDKLLKKKDWEQLGNFESNPCYACGDLAIVTINPYHLYYDNIDLVVKKKLALSPEVIIVASKHRSESGMSTLSVHPIGNYSKAEFGGKERQLVTSCPGMMTNALRILNRKAKAAGLDYQVSFEVTHHGPYLGAPTFFIEIGSLEPQWRDEKAAEAIAETILEVEEGDHPVAVGVGGGHYAPRLTDVALANKISFGHMIPTYALEHIDEEMIQKVVDKTPGSSMVYFHRKALKKSDYSRLKELFESHGLKPVRENDLEDL
jgi:D-aminoacyl-tRNA deacylase